MSAKRRSVPAPAAHWNYWAALLGASLVATLLPWYLGVIDIDVRPTLRALLTGGALALAVMQLDLTRYGELAAALPHVLGVMVLGTSWYLLGTFEVTGFLILFAVPTYAVALECGRWTVLGVASLTVIVAAVAAFATNPELRWQLQQIDALANLLPLSLGNGLDELRFASSSAGREQLVTLAVFAVTILAVAGVGSSAAEVIYGQAHMLQKTDRAHRESASLVSKLLDDSRAMEAIVDSTSGRVHSVNQTFRETLGEARPGDIFIEMLRPVYPEPWTHLLLAPTGGTIAAQGCNPHGRPSLLDVEVQPFVLDGEPMRRVQLRRTAANDIGAAGLDALGIAVAILGPDKSVAFANEAFRALFPRAAAGTPAAAALDDFGLPARWWDIAPSGAAQARFEHDGKRCTARVVLDGARAGFALTSIELRVEDAT
jgi:hypothetical protein